MVRLDKYLVIKGYFQSRERAKEAIRRGFVKVSGRIITKPSYEVSEFNDISIEISPLAGRPRGYWKLMDLDRKWNIFKGGEVVLDLGSSAGGFLQYASERASMVYGIECSEKFRDVLKAIENSRENVKVFIEDAFKFNPERLPMLDLILVDMTLDPIVSYQAVKRYLDRLKRDGMVLFIAKIGKSNKLPSFKDDGLDIVNIEFAKDKKEIYILLRKVVALEP